MNYRYEKSERPARITSATTAQLLDLWDLTEAQPMSEELPILRGWIMDELNERDPFAFDAWHKNEDYLDAWKESPRAYFTPASELFNVGCETADGQHLVFWGVTIDEAYKRATLGSKLSFKPVLWKTSFDGITFILDIVRESWSGTLAIGTLAQIETFESEIQHLTVAQLMHSQHYHN